MAYEVGVRYMYIPLDPALFGRPAAVTAFLEDDLRKWVARDGEEWPAYCEPIIRSTADRVEAKWLASTTPTPKPADAAFGT